jgi:arylsulfatase A-like enzyme
VFTSDGGVLLGEHRLTLKGRGYEPAIRVPLIVRYPPRAPAGRRPPASALNLDLAPTLLDLAGVPAPEWMQGRSLVPVLDGSASEIRPSWLYVQPYRDSPKSTGVRTDRFKYFYHPKNEGNEFLIDLAHDPEERTNLAADPAHAERLRSLRAALRELLAGYGAPPEWGPPPS